MCVGVCQIQTPCGYAGGFSVTPPVFPFPVGNASPGPERKNFALCVKADEQTRGKESETEGEECTKKENRKQNKTKTWAKVN